jgi:hypothetical protein
MVLLLNRPIKSQTMHNDVLINVSVASNTDSNTEADQGINKASTHVQTAVHTLLRMALSKSTTDVQSYFRKRSRSDCSSLPATKVPSRQHRTHSISLASASSKTCCLTPPSHLHNINILNMVRQSVPNKRSDPASKATTYRCVLASFSNRSLTCNNSPKVCSVA